MHTVTRQVLRRVKRVRFGTCSGQQQTRSLWGSSSNKSYGAAASLRGIEQAIYALRADDVSSLREATGHRAERAVDVPRGHRAEAVDAPILTGQRQLATEPGAVRVPRLTGSYGASATGRRAEGCPRTECRAIKWAAGGKENARPGRPVLSEPEASEPGPDERTGA